MRVEIRKSAVKDFKKIAEPYKSKIKKKIAELEKLSEYSLHKKADKSYSSIQTSGRGL